MKNLKLILFFIITSIGFIITIESFQLYTSNYFDFKYSQIVSYNELFSKEDVSNINLAAKKFNVAPFLYNKTNKGNTQYIDIYTNKDGKKILSERRELQPKIYRSFFCGKTDIKYHTFNKIADNDKIYDKGIFVIGEDKDIDLFDKELQKTYDCNFTSSNSSSYKSYKLICNILWTTICAFASMIILYDNRLSKKEIIIRSVYGESITKLVIHKCCKDFIIWFFTFTINILIVYFFLHRAVINNTIMISFIFLVLLNTLLSISLFFCDYTHVIKNKKYNKFLLSFNYIFKVISTVFCVLIISANLIIATESFNVYKQKDFFDKHKDYYYINPVISLYGRPDFFEIQNKFYVENINKFKAIYFSSVIDKDNTSIYYANYYAHNYIKDEIKELESKDIKGKVYIIVPKQNKITKNDLRQTVTSYLPNVSSEAIDFVTYNYDVNILTFDQNHINTSFYVKNPCIILDGRNNIENSELESNLLIKGINNMLFKANIQDLEQFYKDNDISTPFIFTNCNDNYLKTFNTYKRLLVISSILSIIFIFFEFLIIYMVLKIEYEINAMELALKKIYGYSILKRIKKLIILTFISSIVSINLAILIAQICKIGSIGFVILGGCTLLLLELLLIIVRVKHFEKANIQKILKGGSL